MENLFELLIAAAVGFIIGSWLKEKMMLIRIVRNADDIIKSLQQVQKIMASHQDIENSITDEGVELEVEFEKGQVYAWLKATRQFIGQASTIEELYKIAESKYPGAKFWYNKATKESQSA
jgi:hypothetical protein